MVTWVCYFVVSVRKYLIKANKRNQSFTCVTAGQCSPSQQRSHDGKSLKHIFTLSFQSISYLKASDYYFSIVRVEFSSLIFPEHSLYNRMHHSSEYSYKNLIRVDLMFSEMCFRKHR